MPARTCRMPWKQGRGGAVTRERFIYSKEVPREDNNFLPQHLALVFNRTFTSYPYKHIINPPSYHHQTNTSIMSDKDTSTLQSYVDSVCLLRSCKLTL